MSTVCTSSPHPNGVNILYSVKKACYDVNVVLDHDLTGVDLFNGVITRVVVCPDSFPDSVEEESLLKSAMIISIGDELMHIPNLKLNVVVPSQRPTMCLSEKEGSGSQSGAPGKGHLMYIPIQCLLVFEHSRLVLSEVCDYLGRCYSSMIEVYQTIYQLVHHPRHPCSRPLVYVYLRVFLP